MTAVQTPDNYQDTAKAGTWALIQPAFMPARALMRISSAAGGDDESS